MILVNFRCNIVKLFFDISDDLKFSCGGEAVTSFGENLHQVVSEVTASQVQPDDGLKKKERKKIMKLIKIF